MTQGPLTIALLSPGAMGSAVAARLSAGGHRILTSLDGRSERSRERAAAAGMVHAADAELASADLVLSIVPPADAEPLARRLMPHLSAAERAPLYVDANALGPRAKQLLAALLAEAGCTMVDGAIIGPPPREGAWRTSLYLAGPGAERALPLDVTGLRAVALDGPIGAASALKMCYAGINKGLAGLGTAMLLAAEREGAAGALRDEMSVTMTDLRARFARQIPDMYGKAYRWIAEMREIADFLRDDPAAAMIFEGMAQLYERIADDVAGEGRERALLDRALG